MALLPILNLPDPRLRLVSRPVARIDAKMHALLDDMLATMYDAPGIGLAAIQVGVDLRAVVIDLAKKEGEEKRPMFVLNPEIVWRSSEIKPYEEGCLSIPEYFEEVTRPAAVNVRYMDRTGATHVVEATGLLATALQHEIDHLDGILFIDHISRLKRNRVIKKFTKLAKRDSGEAEPSA